MPGALQEAAAMDNVTVINLAQLSPVDMGPQDWFIKYLSVKPTKPVTIILPRFKTSRSLLEVNVKFPPSFKQHVTLDMTHCFLDVVFSCEFRFVNLHHAKMPMFERAEGLSLSVTDINVITFPPDALPKITALSGILEKVNASIVELPEFASVERVYAFLSEVKADKLTFPPDAFPKLRDINRLLENLVVSVVELPRFAGLEDLRSTLIASLKGDKLTFPPDAFPNLRLLDDIRCVFMENLDVAKIGNLPSFPSLEKCRCALFNTVKTDSFCFSPDAFPKLREFKTAMSTIRAAKSIAMPIFAALETLYSGFETLHATESITFPTDGFLELKSCQHKLMNNLSAPTIIMPSFGSLEEFHTEALTSVKASKALIFPIDGFPKLKKCAVLLKTVEAGVVQMPRFASFEEETQGVISNVKVTEKLVFPPDAFGAMIKPSMWFMNEIQAPTAEMPRFDALEEASSNMLRSLQIDHLVFDPDAFPRLKKLSNWFMGKINAKVAIEMPRFASLNGCDQDSHSLSEIKCRGKITFPPDAFPVMSTPLQHMFKSVEVDTFVEMPRFDALERERIFAFNCKENSLVFPPGAFPLHSKWRKKFADVIKKE